MSEENTFTIVPTGNISFPAQEKCPYCGIMHQINEPPVWEDRMRKAVHLMRVHLAFIPADIHIEAAMNAIEDYVEQWIQRAYQYVSQDIEDE